VKADEKLDMVAQIDIKALTYITTQCSRQAVLSLICSLLNTVSFFEGIMSTRKRVLIQYRLSNTILRRGVFLLT
jgi:hypothetical protein